MCVEQLPFFSRSDYPHFGAYPWIDFGDGMPNVLCFSRSRWWKADPHLFSDPQALSTGRQIPNITSQS